MLGFLNSVLFFIGKGDPTAYGQVTERRRVVISSIGVLAGYLWNSSMDGIAMASEFTDSNLLCPFFLLLCL